MDCSTAANDPRPSASLSARKSPQCISVNTPPVFPDLRPRIWPHLRCLVTKVISDRLLARFDTIGERARVVYITSESLRPKNGLTKFEAPWYMLRQL